MKPTIIFLGTLMGILLASSELPAQKATIEEIPTSISTYPFADPNPIPILTDNKKIYPYHKFEGYSHKSIPEDWKVVHLENDYIELWVLPEVGGKVWGAKEKVGGAEFIYRNEVMKFRNIAMRGPWTSGGIEFNFGVIGHTPATATPVDYALVEESDGSVSCIVGATDWPSRTDWRVKINLHPEKAYFTTEALWYNNTEMHQAYYNWMTAAAFATDDLEFYCPGNQYLKHSGEARPWPYEYNRHIAEYQENNFTSSKSYHVVGEYNDFFGGYFKDSGYGFGHWSRYDEMPGQKLWLWSLARDGGIWEDLLTDTDGQYIEFQAGRLLNQHFSGGHANPITQASFTPQTVDTWTENWFPVLKIGGLTEVSEKAVMHLETVGDQLKVGINALEPVEGTLVLKSGANIVDQQEVALKPLEVYTASFSLDLDKPYTVAVKELDLYYTSEKEALAIKRPFEQKTLQKQSAIEKNYRKGLELMDVRSFAEAAKLLGAVLSEDEAHMGALTALGELKYRQGLYEEGLKLVLKALSMDTYHPYANYVAGIIFKAQGDYINAKEALGWAARSMEFRSAAYSLMSEMELAASEYEDAIHYAQKSLDFNRLNLNARKVLVIANRKLGNQLDQRVHRKIIRDIDPLNHFARFEELMEKNQQSNFEATIHSEFPEQTLLELSLDYHKKGQLDLALELLDKIEDHPIAAIWKAFLTKDKKRLTEVVKADIAFVFPYRRETLDAISWANSQMDHWKLKYYYALNLWNKDQVEASKKLFEACYNQPDNAIFYLTRASLQQGERKETDLLKAMALDDKNWRTFHALTQYYWGQKDYQNALKYSESGFALDPNHIALGMNYAKTLIYQEGYPKALEVLGELRVLPFEGASEGRKLYEWAHYGRAMNSIAQGAYLEAIEFLDRSKEWPETLGVGKPFNPDNRMADYLLAKVYQKMGATDNAQKYMDEVINYTQEFPFKNGFYALLGLNLMDDETRTEQMIQTYDQASDLSIPIQWALAKTANENRAVQQLEKEAPSIFSGVAFDLLKRAMEIE